MSKLYYVRETFSASRVALAENGVERPAPAKPSMDECLAEINALPGVLKPLTADDITVLGLWLCNDLPFKDGRRQIMTAAIPQIAQLVKGAPYILNHDTWHRESLGVGRAFRGVTAAAADGSLWCGPLFYIQHRQALVDGEGLAASIEGGTISEASVGMYVGACTCSIDGEDAGDCEHAPGIDYGPGKGVCLWQYSDVLEVEEFSAVMSGAVAGTGYYRIAASHTREAAIDLDQLEEQTKVRAARGPLARWMEAAAERRAAGASRWEQMVERMKKSA